jgi:cystathionine gamma-lyase
MIDGNTSFTPYIQNPLNLDADMTVHSITKNIGGQSDAVMGAITMIDKALFDRIYFTIKSITVVPILAIVTAFCDAKNLHIRVKRSIENAKKIADLLEKHPKVDRVIYPGIKSHPLF